MPSFVPISVVPDPSSVNSGGSTNVTVNLAGAPSADETVNIGTNQPGYFTNLPASVVVPAGQTSRTFNVTTTSSASGDATITASAAGGQASAVLKVGPQNPGN